jgi:precorrin-6A/cobalt-precorrin-6A reductase
VRVLVLGGTGEARALAAELVDRGIDVVSSLAGRVSAPALPVGTVRVGGFGGVVGLADHLVAEGFDHVVDATHPFAAQITANAVAATARVGVPLVRLQRPGWAQHPLAGTFTWVDDVDAAREAAEGLGRRPFLTTGRQQLDAFAAWDDRYVLARVVDPPHWEVPATWEVLRARGPYPYAAERELLESRRIDVLLTKDSGGALTAAKLLAAHDVGVPVVVVRRPAVPDGVRIVESVAEAVAAVAEVAAVHPAPAVAGLEARPTVVGLPVAKARRLSTRSVTSVQAEAGAGLVGDRYHGSRHRHVTVQSAADLEAAAADLGRPVDPGLTRRNVTISGGAIPTKPGTRITIGGVELEVVRIAAPCRLLDDELGPGAARALHARGGTVFRLLTSGTITVGDEVDLTP